MESKWPFMLITFGLIFGLGLTIAGLEKKSVMNNWVSRRCELPVIATAMFFKPDSDSRTKGDFAKDNFDFCMKSFVEKFMALLMAPITALIGQTENVSGGAVNAVGTIREIAAKLYNTLETYLDQFYRRFNASVFEISRVVQFLRMAVGRMNAMVMSMLYSGITLFRGMLNSIQFVIKVILIVCGIMVAIIIILFFILFPFIPMILAVLGGVVATVLSLTAVMSSEIAQQAESDKGGFCFAEKTQILVRHKNEYIQKNVEDIKIGYELGNGCGKITAIIKMDGKGIKLYDINGIKVSGSHLILGTDSIWKSVASDERAIKTDIESPILYCFNTTTHKIPVISQSSVIFFRDWEEIADNDAAGQYLWNYEILKTLNNNKNYLNWKDSLSRYSNTPLVGSKTKIKTKAAFVSVSDLGIGDEVLTRDGTSQRILGIITSDLDDTQYTELYEYNNDSWIKAKSKLIHDMASKTGNTIITESGEFIIWDEVENKEKLVRDFTDIGYKEIHKTYPMVASRLRLERQNI
jgi:hypothetical protein